METEKYRWTKEADDTVRAMSESGRTVADICDALGITDKQLKNRVNVLRRSDETFPRLNRGERAVEDGEEVTEACETEVKLEPKGELNPLEKEMARMIEEREKVLASKEEEIRELQRINGVLEESVDGFRVKVGELMALIGKKDRIIGKMAEQIYGEEAHHENRNHVLPYNASSV